MPIAELPDKLFTDEVFKAGFRGVFVGGCIKRKEGSSFRGKAHAHYCRGKWSEQKYGGWICIRSTKRAKQINLLKHELAHIITNEGHTKKFYQCIRRLGGSITSNDKIIAPVSTKNL